VIPITGRISVTKSGILRLTFFPTKTCDHIVFLIFCVSDFPRTGVAVLPEGKEQRSLLVVDLLGTRIFEFNRKLSLPEMAKPASSGRLVPSYGPTSSNAGPAAELLTTCVREAP